MKLRKQYLGVIVFLIILLTFGTFILVKQALSNQIVISSSLENNMKNSTGYINQEENTLQMSSSEKLGNENEKEQEIEKIYVHITGEVNNSGVYIIEKGSRVYHVVKEAGGGSEDADLEIVNLAAVVHDGQQIYIPSVEERDDYLLEKSLNDNPGDDGEEISNIKKININTAEKNKITLLPGIGPAKADAVINYRENYGEFTTIEEIIEVKGIGEKTFENIKEWIII